MEIKMTYRQTLKNIVEDKRDYRQTHFHDYSVIATNIHLDEEYMKKLITEIYQQAEAKPDAQPAHQHRLLMFLIQHYCLKVPYLLQRAGATVQQLNQVLQHFDKDAGKYFTKVNTRPFSAIQSEMQRAQQPDRLRPEPVPQTQQQ
eukprot:6176281-Amphidinium_carterae.1